MRAARSSPRNEAYRCAIVDPDAQPMILLTSSSRNSQFPSAPRISSQRQVASCLDYLESQKPPAKYLPQMAWQCICTQRTWADFASYCDAMPEDLQLFIVRYEPPLEYLKELEAEVTKFLEETEQRLNKVQQLRKVTA